MATRKSKSSAQPECLEEALLIGILTDLVEQALALAESGIVPGQRWRGAALRVCRRQQLWLARHKVRA
jgi:hypothetical protein